MKKLMASKVAVGIAIISLLIIITLQFLPRTTTLHHDICPASFCPATSTSRGEPLAYYTSYAGATNPLPADTNFFYGLTDALVSVLLVGVLARVAATISKR